MKKTYRMTFLSMVFVVLEGVAMAQTTAAPSAFSLGATMEDTYRVFGAPNQWYASIPGHLLNSRLERDTALKVYGVRAVEDVYMRQTSTNLYRIKVGWLPDENTSKLHPTMRLRWLKMDVDKPAPATAILAGLPEGIEICKDGCDLYGVDINYQIEGSYVLAFPSKPSQAQLEMASLLATNFQNKETKDGWSVAVRLVLGRGGREYGDRKPPDWSSRIVTISVGTEAHAKVSSGKNVIEPVTKIGAWAPESR
jgi:hypothetical protein